MNSIEKVTLSLDRIEAMAGDQELQPAARMAASMLIMLRPRLEAMMPQDPSELDGLLEALSVWAQSQRSDEVTV